MARTIYFFGGEDSDFAGTGTTTVDTTAGTFRSTMARCSLKARDANSQWSTGNIANFTSVWFHARVWMENKAMSGGGLSGTGSFISKNMIRIFDRNGIIRLAFGYNNTGNFSGGWYSGDPTQWGCHIVNAAGAYTLINSAKPSGGFTPGPSTPDTLDINIQNYDQTLGGSIYVYINGVQVFGASGVTLFTDGNTSINGMNLTGVWTGADPACIMFYYSEVLVSDQDTRNLSLARLTPTADGNTVNWDVGGVTNINEQTLDDLTVNSSGTVGQVQQYTVPAPPTGNYGIVGVGYSARAQQGSFGGPGHLEFGARVGGVDYFDSGGVQLPVALGRVQQVLYTVPTTGNAFTRSDIAAAGFNVGMRSAT